MSISENINKIEGIFIIVNTLLPFIIVVLLSIGITLTWQSMKSSVSDYTGSLQTIVNQAKVAKKEIQEVIKDIGKSAAEIKDKGEDIGKNVNKVVKAFDNSIGKFGTTMGNAVQKLDVPLHIPVIKVDLKIPFGSVLQKPMVRVGNAIAKPFRPLGRSFGQLGNAVGTIQSEVANITQKVEQLTQMEKYLDAVINEYTRLIKSINNIMSAIGTLIKWVGITIGFLVAWFSAGYFLWARRRLLNGIALFTGKPATQLA